MPPATDAPGLAERTLYIGGVYATARPTVIKTLLGSCVAVCLWDPAARVGGMNHFLLPHAPQATVDDPARFGVHAMDLLIGEMLKVGAERSRLLAKVFGGAHVLDTVEGEDSVPARNVSFVLEFLRNDGLRVTAEDLGGYLPRRVQFRTDTGQALVHRLRSSAARGRVGAAERRHAAEPPAYGTVELF